MDPLGYTKLLDRLGYMYMILYSITFAPSFVGFFLTKNGALGYMIKLILFKCVNGV